MRIVAISDTHGFHRQVKLPEGDILIHAGDVSMKGERFQIEEFIEWFAKLDFRDKIFIAGNHDFFFERSSANEILNLIPPNITYLNNTSVELAGRKIWGSPITPYFFNWAFNKQRGEPIARYWEMIPSDTDILITHGPMLGHLDLTKGGQHVGCKDLLLRAQNLKIKAHIFGHIHESYGQLDANDTFFVNACIVNRNYEVVNAPIVFDI